MWEEGKKFAAKWIRKEWIVLGIILGLASWFRLYNLAGLYRFAHDHDLFSWIVKDMMVDGHIRLIGQLTSFDGVFIGPFFYYLLIPFFWLTDMDPIGGTYMVAFLGVLTVFSFYWIFSKIANRKVGLLAALLYAVSINNVMFDRWVVPTQTTVLWSVWYLYANYLIISKKQTGWVLAAGLMGLTWHIHIALLPLIPLPFLVGLMGRSWPSINTWIKGIVVFGLVTAPFWAFEIRHGFMQVKAVLSPGGGEGDFATGWYRWRLILENAGSALRGNIFANLDFWYWFNLVPLAVMWAWVRIRELVDKKLFQVFIGWLGLVFLGEMISGKGLSEYYFQNFTPIPLFLLAVTLTELMTKWREPVNYILGAYVGFNMAILVLMPNLGGDYTAKKALVQEIARHAAQNRYPCVSVNYIAERGTNVGFRYFFWLYGVDLVKPNVGAPIYNVFIPARWEYRNVERRFGELGLEYPEIIVFTDEVVCENPDSQIENLLGFH